MKLFYRELLGVLIALMGLRASATVRYVDVNSTNATPPFTNCASSAATIQDAVDAADPGDDILVTNGVYATGGRAAGNNPSANRVAVDKPLKVWSVNGPQFTVIQGRQEPGSLNGYSAIRCVYLGNGASLSGFTLTNGATKPTPASSYGEGQGGGIWCESSSAVVSNCVVVGNSAAYTGGGAYGGTLNRCTLSSNSALEGGGAHSSTLNNCTLSRNSATYGGGAGVCSLNACAVFANSASQVGGADHCTLNNCTLALNSASSSVGGAWSCQLNNCVVYFNSSPSGANYDSSTMNYCCTTPDPGGVGNITLDPQLASATCLSPASPCLGAGNALYATGVDLDGEPWMNPPSIGCDEFYAGAVTGALTARIVTAYTNLTVNIPADFSALIEGRTRSSAWDFGDGSVATNRPLATHTWTIPGDYAVMLRAYNESNPAGVSARMTVRVGTGRYYVAADNTNPVPPYASWATAATNIQDAVDATAPGSLVLVSNGVYRTGGRPVSPSLLTNRVVVDKAVIVTSVNGPKVTVIEGATGNLFFGPDPVRCVYLTYGAFLSGFTLTNGGTWYGQYNDENSSGGGVSSSGVVSNCVIVGNTASSAGGGAFGGTLINCTIAGNLADIGGGTARSLLRNCILIGNSAKSWGGAGFAAGFYNCTVAYNSATNSPGGAGECGVVNSIVYYNISPEPADQGAGYALNSCTTGSFGYGSIGNITNAPRFIASGNLHLQANSPCINAGKNDYASSSTDADGNPRIKGGTVDMGAYEFQTPASAISYAWLQQYGLPINGSADYADPDGDGMNNWREWRADTVPTNASSALRMLSPTGDVSRVTVSWQSVNTRSYWLERATNLAVQPAFSTIATNLPGQAGTTTYTDSSAVGAEPLFYRVGVQP